MLLIGVGLRLGGARGEEDGGEEEDEEDDNENDNDNEDDKADEEEKDEPPTSARYAGTSWIGDLGNSEVGIWDILGRNEERVLIVDTTAKQKWKGRVLALVAEP